MTAAGASLRWQLLRRLLPPLLLLFALGGGSAYLLVLHYANAVYDSWLIDSVHSLSLVVRQGPDGPTLDLPEASRRLFEWDAVDTVYYRVDDAQGRLIAGSAALPPLPGPSSPPGTVRLYDAAVAGRPVRVACLGMTTVDGGAPVQVLVAETGRKRTALADKIVLVVLVPQLLLIVAAAWSIGRGVGRGLAPLRSLAQRIDRHEHDRSLQALPLHEVPEEMLPLTRAFDGLLERLRAALVAQRKFIADAAHQLRSPLAALKLLIDQLRAGPDAETGARLLEELRIATDRTARLANQMLALARAEPEAVSTDHFADFDLNELVREVGAEWVPRALSKDIDLGFVPASIPALVHGSEPLIAEAINNLIDNALKHARGAVELQVVAGDDVEVHVRDDGPGIPAEDRARARQRFVRLSGAQASGAGLGLAIVDEIMAAHGGRLELRDGMAGRGLCAALRLPRPVVPAR